MARDDARSRCYAAITKSVSEGLARYYLEYPGRILDERATEAQAWSYRGLQRVFAILDTFEITDRPSRAASKDKEA